MSSPSSSTTAACSTDGATFTNVVLVLGCKPNDDGTVSPWLAARIDAAASLYHQLAVGQKEDTVLVVSGAAVGCKLVTEAALMAEGLTRRHKVPARDVLLEAEAVDTATNAAHTVASLLEHPRCAARPDPSSSRLRMWLLTSDFHVARGALMFAAVLRRSASSSAALRPRIEFAGETQSCCLVKDANDDEERTNNNWAKLNADQLAAIQEILPAEHLKSPLAPLWGVAAAPSPGLVGAKAEERRLWELKSIGEQLPSAVAWPDLPARC